MNTENNPMGHLEMAKQPQEAINEGNKPQINQCENGSEMPYRRGEGGGDGGAATGIGQAGWQPAVQQINNLHYGPGVNHLGIEEVEPWPEAVDGAELLSEIRSA